MKRVVLAGNAITADILLSYLKRDARYEVVGLTVDDDYVDKGTIKEIKTIGLSQLSATRAPRDCAIIMAMGYNDLNRSRESLFLRLKEMGYSIETYIHPDAKIYTDHPLGEGSIVLPSAVIEPHARLGANSMVWCNATLAHHSSVADHCWVASGAVLSGQVTVQRNTFVGVNATIVNNVTIGDYCIIGGGALITKTTEPSTVHLARSAEQIRFSSQDYVKYFGV